MAADYSQHPARGYSASAPQPGTEPYIAPPPPVSRGQRVMNLIGAFGSVALIASLGWWGWELAVRDLRGVPVVRALEGPMRVAPEDPGGAVVDHQGLAVNDVAARDGSVGSDRLVLAPAPVELTLEDVPGLSNDLQPLTNATASLPDSLAEPRLPEPPAEALSQEDAVAAALAEALGTDPEALAGDLATDLPPGAMAASLRPRTRPEGAAPAAPVAPAVEIDPASLAAGVRLVQFGAYDTAELARAEWAKIAARLGPLMVGKAMVVEAAESGGMTFWRLRGHGFENEDDARRFCSAAVAEGVNCIPVTKR